jgi:SAM-dependent methyltransferase
MDRVVHPELLDSLAADHPDAIAARRDLRVIDWFMRNSRWVAAQCASHLTAGESIGEIGAGDGALGRIVAARHPQFAKYRGFDLAPAPDKWPRGFAWTQGDIFGGAGHALAGCAAVVSILTLHHFSDSALARLGERLDHARVLIFCEPARRRLHLWQGKMLALLGIGRVTRHDLPVSIRAGFLGDELPRLLRLDPAVWSWKIVTTFFGAYRMIAQRRDSARP